MSPISRNTCKSRSASLSDESWRPLPLDEVRRMHIQRVLDLCKGNRVRTAQVLGIGRTSLYRFLKRSPNGKAMSKSA